MKFEAGFCIMFTVEIATGKLWREILSGWEGEPRIPPFQH